MRIVRYDDRLRRVYVLGQRLHHGMVGAVAYTAGVAVSRRSSSRIGIVLVTVGTALMVDDLHDWPWVGDQDAYHFGPRLRS